MKKKYLSGLIATLLTSVPTASLANVIDIQVNSDNNQFIVSPTTSNDDAYQYRVVLKDLATGESITSNWQSSKFVRINAELSKKYDITLQAKDLTSGTVHSLTEEQASLSSGTQFKGSRQTPATLSIKQTPMNSTLWDSAFNVDSNQFPQITITSDLVYDGLNFDGTNTQLPLIDKSGITIEEDGRFETITRFVQPSASSTKKIVDIVFVHDDSGSLGDEAAQVRANITAFVQGLTDENFDYRIGLLPYGGDGGYYSFSSPGGTLLHNGALSDNATDLQADIDNMKFDGYREQAFDALSLAAKETLWRPNTQKVIILVTDEDNDIGLVDESTLTNTLVDNNVLFYGLTAGHDEYDRIAAAVSGKVFNIRSDFSSILTEIGADLSSRYITQYESDNSNFDGVERVIDFTVDALDANNNNITETFELRYTPTIPVELTLDSATSDLLSRGQLPSKELPIGVSVISEVPVSSVRLGYKHSSQSYFTLVDMTNQQAGYWTADIPSHIVDEGAVEFYLSAITDNGIKTLPSIDPQSAPYVVTVLPNVPPVFTHTPVKEAELSSDIQIDAFAEDASNEVTVIKLYYREVGSPVFTEVETMVNQSQVNYTGIIPQEAVTSNGVEYFLVAIDDFGSETYLGSIDNPYVISVNNTDTPSQCSSVGTVEVCADRITMNSDQTAGTASGNVQFGLDSGEKVLAFSGSLVLDTVNETVSSLGPGRLRAVNMLLDNSNVKDVALGYTSFNLSADSSGTTLSFINPIDYLFNGVEFIGDKITLDHDAVYITTSVDLPLYTDFSGEHGKIINAVSLGDIKLSQLNGDSSAEISLDLQNTLPDNSIRIGRFGKSGLSTQIDTVKFDLLQPGVGAAGSLSWNQAQYGLDVDFALSPVELEKFSFVYTDLKKSSFNNALKLPLGTTGFVVAHSNTSLEWQRLPEHAISGSVHGYFSDAAGGMALAGDIIGKDILSGALGVSIINGGNTWVGSGDLTLLDDFNLFSTKLTAGLLSSGQKGMLLDANLNIADILTGSALFNAQSGASYTQFLSRSNVTVSFPDSVAIVGGTALLGALTETLIKVDHAKQDALTAYTFANINIAALSLGAKVDFSDPSNINVSLLAKNKSLAKPAVSSAPMSTRNANSTYDIAVASDVEGLFITVSAQGGIPEMQLTAPDGTVLSGSDFEVQIEDLASTASDIVYFTNGSNKATFVLNNALEGDYQVNILNADSLNNIEVQSIEPLTTPTALISSLPSSASAGQSFDVEFELSDLTANAEIEFSMFLEGAPESVISLSVADFVNGQHIQTIDVPANVAPGTYYVAMDVRSPDGILMRATSSTSIAIDNLSVPEAPTGLSVDWLNSAATVNWDTSSLANITTYVIRLRNDITGEYKSVVVDQSSAPYTITGLVNGETYSIAIAAITQNGEVGAYSYEINGTPSGNFVSGSPDLQVSANGLQITSLSGNKGEPITLSATIENIGRFDAYSSRVNCYYGIISEKTLVSSQLMANIASQASSDIECVINQKSFAIDGGKVFVTISDAVLEEVNFANNVAVASNPYAPNLAPVATDDSTITNEDVAVDITPLVNDTDANRDDLNIESFTQPANGTVKLSGNTLTYSPNKDYYGLDSFTYTVTDGEMVSNTAIVYVDVTAVNDAPVIGTIPALNLDEDTNGTMVVIASDVDNDPLTIDNITQPQFGSVSVNENKLIYTPNKDYFGQDTFSYTVTDGVEISNEGNVEVNVASVNDAPIITAIDPITISEGETATVNVVATDIENDTLTYKTIAVDSNPLGLDNADSSTVHVTSSYVSEETVVTLTVEVSDGTDSSTFDVPVTILNDNQVPSVEVTAPSSVDADSQVEFTIAITDDSKHHGIVWEQTGGTSVSISQHEDGTISFTAPNVTRNEVLSFSVTVTDGEHETKSEVSLKVMAPEQEKDSGGSLGSMILAFLMPLAITRRFLKKR
ncbi:Ig-like domain-containing protein [Thalassotalea maritima]|uniref:Ig-like domain-containing protein n=1 Tax=Thalassotalea maritima TaxID=3242416 RepID=UPI003528C626